MGCGNLQGSSAEDFTQMVIFGDAEVQVMGDWRDHQLPV